MDVVQELVDEDCDDVKHVERKFKKRMNLYDQFLSVNTEHLNVNMKMTGFTHVMM